MLTVTGTAVAGGTRVITALFSPTPEYLLKSATWANGGPMREYEFIIDPNPSLNGKIREVRDAAGNVLLHFEYDDQGRLIETNRGTGPTFQILSRQAYIDTSGSGNPLDDTNMVSQCFVDDTDYQAIVYTFDKYNRITEKEEFHDLQNLPVASAEVPMFTGDSSVTTTLHREDEDLDVPDDHYTIEKVLPSGNVAEYTVFDSDFNIIRTFMRGNHTLVIDSVGNRTEHDYDALGLRIETRHYEDVLGTPVLQLRVARMWTTREQRAVQTKYDVGGTALDQQRWGYGTLGFQDRWSRMRDPASSDPVNVDVDRVVDSEHDGVGRALTRTTYAEGASRTTAWDYDDIGRLKTVTRPVAGNTETLAYYTNSTRIETRTVTDENGAHVIRTAFDPFGRLETQTAEGTAPNIITAYAYDATDRRVTETDPEGTVTCSTYDGIGQLAQLVEDCGGADERTFVFEYTQQGDLEKVTADDGEGPQITSYEYDLASRRTKLVYPDSPEVPAEVVDFTYDNAGRMQTRTTRKDDVPVFVTYYTHNWRGQVREKRQDGPVGQVLEEFVYDSLGLMTGAGVGSLATATYKSTFVYGDGANGPAFVDQPVSETQTVNSISKTITRDCNTAGERSELSYPDGCNQTLTYSRDGFGQVTAIDRNGSRLVNYAYAGRNVTSRQVRTTASSGEAWIEVVWNRPDQLRRPETITNRVRTGSTGGQGGTVVDLIGFANVFDGAGNLEEQTVSGSPVENGLFDHTYDGLHRLTQSDYPDATSETWQLDDLSNWEQYTARDTSVTTYADNILNQYTSISGEATAPLHDMGNLVRNERGYGFSYDFENRLPRVFTDDSPANGVYDPGETVHAEYVIDALGRRVQATVDSSTTYRYYDTNGVILAEYDDADPASPVQLYINGTTYMDEKILMQDALGQEHYYLLGHLYTVTGLVDEDGEFLEVYTYTAYGLPTITTFGNTSCTRGDINGDERVDGNDIQFFTNVALGHDTEPSHVCAADIDGDNDVDTNDAALLVACLLSGNCASVCSPGDLNADGQVDETDATLLVQVLLAATSDPLAFCAADLNTDGLHDARDIQAFVNCAIYNDCPSPPSGGPQPINNPFLFTGQRLDTLDNGNLLLYDYKARAYAPLHGRFQQRDPAEFADTHNLYEYAASRPTVLTDPTGEFIGAFAG